MQLEESETARSTASLAALLALALFAFAGFMALGVWQVHRLAWKEELIARVDARLHADAHAAPGRRGWSSVTREADEYRRVFVQGRFDFAHEVLVHASTSLGSGYWVITPLRTDAGDWVLVNRGFIPPELREKVPRGDANASTVGLLRMSEPGGSLLQSNDPLHGRWYSRDVTAIAAHVHLADAAPYFIDQQAATRADDEAWPRPGLTVVQFPNNHLVYALTWFALAAGVAAAAAYLLAHERYLRRLEPGPVPSRAY
jgi:surfeit locus 1 family protein